METVNGGSQGPQQRKCTPLGRSFHIDTMTTNTSVSSVSFLC
jgi:hypothetical protein